MVTYIQFLKSVKKTAIFNKKIRDEIFPDNIYSYEIFKSTSYLEDDYLSRLKTYEKDACLVYKKAS